MAAGGEVFGVSIGVEFNENMYGYTYAEPWGAVNGGNFSMVVSVY